MKLDVLVRRNLSDKDFSFDETHRLVELKKHDTGWRKIQSNLFADGYIMVRRQGDICYLTMGGGRYGTFSLKSKPTGNRTRLGYLPVGFRTSLPAIGLLTTDGERIVGQIVGLSSNDTSAIQVRGFTGDKLTELRPSMIIYPATDDFPDEESLPPAL